MKKIIDFKLGDVVQLNKDWNNRIGIVMADGRSWYVPTGGYDIANCICDKKDVVRVIKRNVVNKKYLKYVK